MASLVVHLAVAGLIAAALLPRSFDWRALAVVGTGVVLVDADAFLTPVIESAHRAAGHTLVWPALLAVGLLWAGRLSADRPATTGRIGRAYDSIATRVLAVRTPRRYRLAWVTLAAVVFAAIGFDLFEAGVNLFWPIHDQFYTIDGQFVLSTTKGIDQTFVDLSASGGNVAAGSTEETFYSTGIDPQRGAEPANVERRFPIVWSGQQLLLVIASAVVVTVRLLEGD